MIPVIAKELLRLLDGQGVELKSDDIPSQEGFRRGPGQGFSAVSCPLCPRDLLDPLL